MMNGLLRKPGVWLFVMTLSLAGLLVIKDSNFAFILCNIGLIFSVMALFLFILNNSFPKHIKDNFEKGLALCLLGGISGAIPEIINLSPANDSAVYKIAMLPFTVFMFAGAGAGGSILATGMSIEKRKPSARESALNANKIRKGQRRGS